MHVVKNFFTHNQIEELRKEIDIAKKREIQKDLGRLCQDHIALPDSIRNALFRISYSINKNLLGYGQTLLVEYSNEYGKPNLPPHFDGDSTDLIVNYQLESNTQWDVGVDLKTYSLEDNSAIIFNPNEHIHWRPHKEFGDGEYVKMMFFRFYNRVHPNDFSHLALSKTNPIFDEVNAFRNSI